ncbi:MAG: hypothetical protein ROZ09_02595 [Thiobacillus sp.]|jgi:hypothetical protein|uniref:hypothetical protein n=1 Tax=Thiobacillus sp. TaxID=924 RepID=UPI00289532A3|nr:hypothetical protein [Thiobacillus sp.]MDT3705686.1 hypothetical protein [Thiobacillus sp.]
MNRRSSLLSSLMQRLKSANRKAAPGPGEPGGKLFRDQPGDWKDAVYAPKALRRKKRS